MKDIYRLAAVGLGLAGLRLDDIDESIQYELKLEQMARKQIREYQDGDTTYRVGVDFMTNEPRFRLKQGETPDQRSKNLGDELSRNLWSDAVVGKGIRHLDFIYRWEEPDLETAKRSKYFGITYDFCLENNGGK